MGADPSDDDRRRRLLHALRDACSIRGRSGDGRRRSDGRRRHQVHPVPRLRRHHHRPVGVPDRIRLRRTAVPPGVPADADRRGGGVRLSWRPASCWAAARRSSPRCWRSCCAASSRSWSGPILGAPINWFALYLGPAVVVELIAPDAAVQAAHHLRRRQRARCRHRSGCGWSRSGSTRSTTIRGRPACGPKRWRWPSPSRSSPVPAARCSAWCSPITGRLPSPCDQHRSGGADRAGHRRRDRQRAALQRAAERHRHNRRSPTLPAVPGKRMVNADVRINPPNFVSDNPNWVSILAWQGHLENQRGEVVTNLEQLGPGHYRTTEPVPVWGTWKTLLRLHDGETLAAVPDLSRRRSGYRREGGSGGGVDDAAVRRRDHHSAARAQPRNPGGAVDDRLPGGAVLHADPRSAASVGAQAGSTEASPRAARRNSSQRRRRDRATTRRDTGPPRPASRDTGIRAGDSRRGRRDLHRDAGSPREPTTTHSERQARPAKMVHRENIQDSRGRDDCRTPQRRMRRIERL